MQTKNLRSYLFYLISLSLYTVAAENNEFNSDKKVKTGKASFQLKEKLATNFQNKKINVCTFKQLEENKARTKNAKEMKRKIRANDK